MKDLGKETTPSDQAVALSAKRVTHVVASTDDAGQRLDNFLLKHCKGVPKSHVYRVIRSGEVRIDGGRAQPESRLEAGQQIRIPPIRIAERETNAGAPAMEFPILFEDNDLLVIDKPAGVAVHGGSGINHGVIERLRAARPRLAFLELVHRLDRETSGVLLLAKKRKALVSLHEQLSQSSTDKRYWALVRGRVVNARQHVKAALLKTVGERGERHVFAVDAHTEGAQAAHTIVNVREAFGPLGPLDQGATWVEAQLRTGRTHQIRVHLAHLGHPILGDERYGDFALNKQLPRIGLKRMFLHAASFGFVHPSTGEPMQIGSPLPADCQRFLERLRG